MTMEQIKQSWKQSQMKPVDEKGNIKVGSTHDKFTADMCEKTAINKVCKYVINSSDDKSIVARFAREMDNELQEAAVEAEIEENANKEILDIEPEYEVVDEPQTAAETPRPTSLKDKQPKYPWKGRDINETQVLGSSSKGNCYILSLLPGACY